jgi:GDP-L-fucose synthase
MNTNLLRFGYKYGVNRFIGILSTCIYPDTVETYPMRENMLHMGPPTQTNFSYGYAKRAMAVQIDAYNKQYGTKYQYLIPSNLYGPYDKWGENSHFVAALIKKIIIADRNGIDTIQLFGTGTPLRQFTYSYDLARVIKYCIDGDITDSFNVTSSESLSIREIAETAIDVINPKYVKYISFDSSKPDGQFRKDVSNDKMYDLIPNFKFTSLRDGIKSTYDIVKFYNF